MENRRRAPRMAGRGSGMAMGKGAQSMRALNTLTTRKPAKKSDSSMRSLNAVNSRDRSDSSNNSVSESDFENDSGRLKTKLSIDSISDLEGMNHSEEDYNPNFLVTRSPLARQKRNMRSTRPGFGGLMATDLNDSFTKQPQAKSITFQENGATHVAPLSRINSIGMGPDSADARSTKLHKVAGNGESTIEELKNALNEEPSAACIPDEDGKLPLHIISENEELTENLGSELDEFILDELIPRNRKALVARDNKGQFPFVQPLIDWVEGINDLPVRKLSEMGLEMDEDDRDQAEQLIPWNVAIDDIAFWGIKMLSVMIKRESLRAFWVWKVIEVIAEIPCFLKNILLIDDEDTLKELMATRLVHEVILHPSSMGPWLVYMIISEEELGQARALMFLKLVTDIDQTISKENHGSRSRISSAFVTSDSKIRERKQGVYNKAARLPAIIPAMMQFRNDYFIEASSTSLVQHILDAALFQPETTLVILLDMFFLLAAVVIYTLSSNKVFALVNSVKYAPETLYYVNQTAYDLCKNGTLTDENACRYANEEFEINSVGSVIFAGTIDCGVGCSVCEDPSSFAGGILEYDPTAWLIDIGPQLTTCYNVNTSNTVDIYLISAIVFMALNASYFITRQICTWYVVPKRYFGSAKNSYDFIAVIHPVLMLAIFLAYIYDLPPDRDTLPIEFHDVWLQNAQMFSAFSAVAIGLLYMRVILYFKVLNQYTATFIFALGEVMKDISWFTSIMLVIVFMFSQMFYTTLSCTEGYCRVEGVTADAFGDIPPFDQFTKALVYSYSILLGQLDLQIFDTPFTIFLWCAYTFVVVIVVLNFLIAIVGDSYDKSMTKIETHFGRARLVFMVEVSAFLSYVVAPLSSGNEKQGYRRWLLCRGRRGTLAYLLFTIGLCTGFAVLVIQQDIIERGGMERFVTMTVIIILLVLSPCFWKLRAFGSLSKLKIFQILGYYLTAVFRLFLGKSIRGHRTDFEKKEWGGRIAHLVSSIDEKIRESEDITAKNIASTEAVVNKSIDRLEFQMSELQNANEENNKSSSDVMNKRIAELEGNVSEIKALVGNIHAMLEESRERESYSSAGGGTSNRDNPGVVYEG